VIELAAAKKIFGDRSLGAAFNVLAPGKYRSENNDWEEVKTWSYAVKAGDKIKALYPVENFENGIYHVCIYGPNGFFREFRGDENDPAILMAVEYEIKNDAANHRTANLLLSLHNKSGEAQTVYMEDKSYKNPMRVVALNESGQTITESFSLENSFNWYDLSIKVKGKNNFEKRYAGRVETGEHGITDPAMGGA
jgi:phospholipase C